MSRASNISPPIRVVMLVDALLGGGAERIAVELACHLDRARFETSLIATRLGGPLAEALQTASVPYVILGRRHGFSPAKLRRAHNLIVGSDVLHAHKYGSNMWGSVLARTTRVPLVVREPTFSGRRSLARTLGYRFLVGRTARRVICPTDVVARSLLDDGIPADRIRIIPNGVPLDAALPPHVARRELGIDATARVIGIVARLRPEKSHEVLFSAAAEITERYPNLKLAVVGDGWRRAALEQHARDIGLAERVVWAGERRDARRLVSAFDIGVICSAWEGLSVAALETMAAGVPLVSTRVGTMPDLLSDEAGMLVDVGDASGLAAALSTLLDDSDRARRIGAAGRERIRRLHVFERMVEEFASVYEEVAVEPRRRRPGRDRLVA